MVKNLGIHIDRYLTFEKHIDEVCRKTMGTLVYLNRVKENFDQDTRVTVVQTLVLSVINYCTLIWGSASVTQIKRLQKLQNFAAKIALGNGRKYDRATPYVNKLNWMKISNKSIYDCCVFVYKMLNNELSQSLCPINRVEEVNPRNTRQRQNLIVPRTNTMSGDRNLAVRGPKLWNKLPIDIREAPSLPCFKVELKSY